MFKLWFLKRELKKWQFNLESLEIALEYSNSLTDDEIEMGLEAVHECWKIIDGLKLLINHYNR